MKKSYAINLSNYLLAFILNSLILSFSTVPCESFAQNWEWANQIGNNKSESVTDVKIGQDSAVYVTGIFEETLTIGNISLTSIGGKDIFIAKYDAAGNVIWAISGGSNDNDDSGGIAIDDLGNVYLAASFWEEMTFDTLTINGGNSSALLLAKFNTDGQILWAKTMTGSGLKVPTSLEINEDSFLYFGGYFGNDLLIGNEELIANGTADLLIAKYDTDGNYEWSSHAGQEGFARLQSLAVSPTGEVYATGYFKGKIKFGADTIQSITFDNDIFTCKYDNNGDLVWAKKAGGVYDSFSNAIVLDEMNNAYIAGTFLGVVKFDDNLIIESSGFNNDIIIAKYNSEGTALWAKPLGSMQDEEGVDIAIEDNILHLAGHFNTTTTLGNITLTTTENSLDIFLAELNLGGSILSATQAGNDINPERMVTMDILSGDIAVAGYFTKEMNLGELSLINEETQSNIFVAKWRRDPLINVKQYPAKNTALHIFPNPSKGRIELSANFDFPINTPIRIGLTDLQGRYYLLKEINSSYIVNDLFLREVLDLGRFGTGLFVVSVEVNAKKFVAPLILVN